jgi:thymidylate synthase ThyX
VFDKILTETFRAPVQSGYDGEIQRTVNGVVLSELMALAANERASNEVRAIAELQLDELKNWAASTATRDRNQRAFLLYTANQIKRFQDDPKKMNLTKPNDPPDGQPIGTDWWAMMDQDWCGWR